MASLRELARQNIQEASEWICWFALWKSNRSWEVEIFWCEYDERTDCFKMDEEDQERAREILAEDYGAVLVNGYYDNIGSLEEMTVSSLTDGFRFQYERKRTLLCDCVA